jgi:hypothetical protein
MSLSLAPSADGSKVQLLLGATIIGEFSANGVEQGALLATALEAQGLTNAKKLLSPDMLNKALQGANQSLAASGYQKLPGGLILQWGTTASIPNGTVGTVTFPIAFPNAAFIGLAITAAAGGGSANVAEYINPLTASSMGVYNGAGNSNTFRWFALGW